MSDEIDRNWPAWYYGPDGAAEIFEKKADVPKGWQDHPSKVEQKTKSEALDL